MKILLLTQYFPPEFGAAAARSSEHAHCWAEAGHEVEVCTGFPNYPDGVVPEEYRGRFYMRQARDGYIIHRSWIYATPNRAMWRRVLASLSFMVSALFAAVRKCRKPEVIIASSGPFFVGPLGYLVSVIKRAPFVFEVRDLLPKQAVDVGMIKSKIVIRLLYCVESFLYRRSKAVVTVAPASRDVLVERGIPAEKVAVIENGIRPEFYKPGPKENEVRSQYGWQDKFVAMYIGAHGVSQGLYTLLDAAEKLHDANNVAQASRPPVNDVAQASRLPVPENVVFVFVGDGAEKEGMQQRARQRGLDNVEFLPLHSKDWMPLFYAAADVCFVPLRRGDYFTLNIPSKIFEIMACQRPIILGARGQAERIVKEAGAGLIVEPEDADAYAEAVRELMENPEKARELGEHGRDYVLNNFTRRQKAEEYLGILQRFTG